MVRTLKKVKIIMQARMGSERLPGKVLIKIQGKSLLGHIISRMKKSNLKSDIIVATSTDEKDNLIEKECKNYGINVFRGSNLDVLDRFYNAAIKFNADHILRICCDNPFADYMLTDKAIEFYLKNNYDYVSTKGFPIGINVEIFSLKELQKAYEYGMKSYQREHVTPYIIENSSKAYYYSDIDYSQYRMTVDTKEDLLFAETVYSKLYTNPYFNYLDIINLLLKEPEIHLINKNIIQKQIINAK